MATFTAHSINRDNQEEMGLRKNFRADNTYLISTDSTDNPKLGAKLLSDGRESLFLDYYMGYELAVSKSGKEYKHKLREREYLKLYLWQTPRTTLEKAQNRETLEIAKRVRYERAQQILEQGKGYRLRRAQQINFLDWMEIYHESYTKADRREINRARKAFGDFLTSTERYAKYSQRIQPDQITKAMITAFTDYLQKRYRGEGAHTCYARFKKMVKAAVEEGMMKDNPTTGISIKIDRGTLQKDVLSEDEVHRLTETHYQGENPDIRRAFIFCLYCGLRWCDVKELRFTNVDYANRRLHFDQAKTKGHSSASGVEIPLNDWLLSLIGKPTEGRGRDEVIFPLPSHNMCLKALERWTQRAGIDKHITWHCARHSFAVNTLSNGLDIKTVSSLLGHSGLKHTEKYTRAVDSLKVAAINSLRPPSSFTAGEEVM